MKQYCVRSANCAKTALWMADPRHYLAIVKTQHELHTHRNGTRTTFDHPDHFHLPEVSINRHEVGDGHHTIVRLEDGFEDYTVIEITAVNCLYLAFGCDQPSTLVGTAKQGREAHRASRFEPARPTSAALCMLPISA